MSRAARAGERAGRGGWGGREANTQPSLVPPHIAPALPDGSITPSSPTPPNSATQGGLDSYVTPPLGHRDCERKQALGHRLG
eukprot:scaffold17729_cov80-Isochrysis_galbana.AAC.3